MDPAEHKRLLKQVKRRFAYRKKQLGDLSAVALNMTNMVFFAVGERQWFTTNCSYRPEYGVTPEAFEEARAADVEAILERKAAHIQRWLVPLESELEALRECA